MNLNILYEDRDILVCEKPAGIATQSKRVGAPDMVSILKNHLHQSAPNQQPYLAVIHRLDQPVTGLLVFGKTKKAAANLTQQLTTSGFGKHYLAVLTNTPGIEEADLVDYIVKDARTNTSRICTKDTPGAKEARLHYQIIQKGENSSIADITLDTGRHHQIRVQMSHIGCPIQGDKKYGAPSTGQLMLFAYRLTFRHPITGNLLSFQLDRTKLINSAI